MPYVAGVRHVTPNNRNEDKGGNQPVWFCFLFRDCGSDLFGGRGIRCVGPQPDCKSLGGSEQAPEPTVTTAFSGFHYLLMLESHDFRLRVNSSWLTFSVGGIRFAALAGFMCRSMGRNLSSGPRSVGVSQSVTSVCFVIVRRDLACSELHR